MRRSGRLTGVRERVREAIYRTRNVSLGANATEDDPVMKMRAAAEYIENSRLIEPWLAMTVAATMKCQFMYLVYRLPNMCRYTGAQTP